MMMMQNGTISAMVTPSDTDEVVNVAVLCYLDIRVRQQAEAFVPYFGTPPDHTFGRNDAMKHRNRTALRKHGK
jgi:hypothetical protein